MKAIHGSVWNVTQEESGFKLTFSRVEDQANALVLLNFVLEDELAGSLSKKPQVLDSPRTLGLQKLVLTAVVERFHNSGDRFLKKNDFKRSQIIMQRYDSIQSE